MDIEKIIEDIQNFTEYEDNWDSYDARPLNKDFAKKCISIIKQIDWLKCPLGYVVPFCDGFQIEWHLDSYYEISFTFYEEDDLNYKPRISMIVFKDLKVVSHDNFDLDNAKSEQIQAFIDSVEDLK